MALTLFEAYRTNAPAAQPFFAGNFGDADARRRAVKAALDRPLAQDVASGLRAQQQRFSNPAREANLTALEGGAAAVVTGQQVGLFLGPLYTAYKAASCIAVARALSAETGHPVVPVFWLQTEDHDLVEIASCNLPCATGSRTLAVPASHQERSSIAHRTLPQSIAECTAALRAELGNLPHQEELERIERHYWSGASFGSAFAGLLAELFEELVIIDPRDRAFGRIAQQIHGTALTRRTELAAALARRAEAIEAAGFQVQVRLRPEVALSFFHAEGAEGPRFRIENQRDPSELLSWLERDPLRFSTSALLRPLLQDSLLPVAAYVGGPGEIGYTAQIGPLYSSFAIPQPLVVPRARLRVLEEKTVRGLSRLGLTADELALPLDSILARFARPALDLRGHLLGPFTAALAELPELDGDLAKAREKTERSVAQSIDKLAEKYERSLLHRDTQRVEEIQRLKTALYPEGAPQERHYSLPYYLARYGTGFLSRVRETIAPFDGAESDLHP